MNVALKLFAGAADAVGQKELSWSLDDGATVQDLLDQLVASYPKLAALRPVLLVSVNHEYAPSDHVLQPGDEVGLIPPVSGGSEREACRLVHEPINPQHLLDQVQNDNAGATLLFLGTVREMTGDKQTLHLDYDAYPEMALAKLNEIVAEVEARWPGARAAITHRLGHLAIGEISVAIAVSCPHRAQAYEASRYAIEQLKKVVPIWKKETWADGSSEWVGHS